MNFIKIWLSTAFQLNKMRKWSFRYYFRYDVINFDHSNIQLYFHNLLEKFGKPLYSKTLIIIWNFRQVIPYSTGKLLRILEWMLKFFDENHDMNLYQMDPNVNFFDKYNMYSVIHIAHKSFWLLDITEIQCDLRLWQMSRVH